MRDAGCERAFAAARWPCNQVGMGESAPALGSAQIVQRNLGRESHNA